MKKILFITTLFACLLTPVYAQSSFDLTDEVKEQIIARIKDKLNDFQEFLGEMANKKFPQQTRQKAYESSIILFIGECEPYEVSDITTGRVERKKAVEMETSSVNSNYIKRQLMKLYFLNILNNRIYSNIKIEQADAVRVDNLRKVGEGRYEAVAHICQYFVGYNDNGYLKYGDKTEKAVKVYVNYKEIPTSTGTDSIFDIKLGNMKVLSTERIQTR